MNVYEAIGIGWTVLSTAAATGFVLYLAYRGALTIEIVRTEEKRPASTGLIVSNVEQLDKRFVR